MTDCITTMSRAPKQRKYINIIKNSREKDTPGIMNNHSFKSKLNLRRRAPKTRVSTNINKQFYHENHNKQEKKDCTHCQIKGASSKLSPVSSPSIKKDFQLVPLCIIFHNSPHLTFSTVYVHHHTINLKIRTHFTWIKSGVSKDLNA